MTNDAIITGMAFTYPEPQNMNEMHYGITALVQSGFLKPVR